MYGDVSLPANTYGSQAAEAWATGATGSTSVVVGIVDSGIDYAHIDLYLNIWLNQAEIPSAFRSALIDSNGDALITFWDLNQVANAGYVTDLNGNGRIDAGDLLGDARWEDGVDGDSNGFFDDLIGWDFVNNDNDPYDDNSHGTHVAGTIGAQGGNGTGVAGVAWSVQMLAVKVISATGNLTAARAALGINYITAASLAETGERFVAINMSFGGSSGSAALTAAVEAAASAGILAVAAAGNNARDIDITPFYPAAINTTAAAGYDAVISVAALDSDGALSSTSNYGAGNVDLGAPGGSIYSTLPGNTYGTKSGTSMATAHVTGAIALYAAENPTATAAQIRAALLGSAVSTAALAGKTVTGGRLDVAAMLTDLSVPCFAAGTAILTRRGEVAVEHLVPGEEVVVLLGGGFARIAWIGQRTVACAAMPHPADAWPLLVRADAFAPGQPHTDLLLSPDHAVHTDGVLIPIRYLENGCTVARLPCDSITYFHVELTRHNVLVAQGLAAESYLDTGNRDDFQAQGHAGPHLVARQGAALATWQRRACAPLHTAGKLVERIRARLAARAAALGHVQAIGRSVTLHADGQAWQGVADREALHFTLPVPSANARLISPAFVPAIMVPGLEDHRCLGVPIARLIVDGHTMPLDHPVLRQGWHMPEPGLRWTAGAATLPRLTSLILVLAPVEIPSMAFPGDDTGAAFARPG